MHKLLVCPGLFLIALCACASDPYGYAPQYLPSSEEKPFVEGAVEPSYEEVRRDPAAYQGQRIAWFGIVAEASSVDPSGETRLTLTHRFHQPRHLCADQFDSSCRVTISAREGGPFTALVHLRPEDASGRNRLYTGSLVKMYGRVTNDYDARGGPVFRIEYYRHWPRGTYVTTNRANNMRR
jgi:hypothetical protein